MSNPTMRGKPPRRIEEFDASVDSSMPSQQQRSSQPSSPGSARPTANTDILSPAPTLNDVVNESERRSTFSSVNFAGVVDVDDQSGETNEETGENSLRSTMSSTSDADEQQQQQQKQPQPQQQQQQQQKQPQEDPKTPDTPPKKPANIIDDKAISVRTNPPSPSRSVSMRFRSVDRPEAEKPLLDEIREVLAQSFLCFLLADLRLMSGTGEIVTKYQNVAVDSDYLPRNTAEQIAGLSNTYALGQCEGLAPSVLMAILILEIRDTFVKTAEEKTKKKLGNKKQISYATTVDIDTDDRFVAYENNEAKRKLTEESMESLMRCYSRMVSEDLVTDIPNVRRRRITMNLLDNKGDVPASPSGYQSFLKFSRRSSFSGAEITTSAEAKSFATGPALVSVREETDSDICKIEDKEANNKDTDIDDKILSPNHLVRATTDFHSSPLEGSEDQRKSFFSPRKKRPGLYSDSSLPQLPQLPQLPTLRTTMALSKQKSKLIADGIIKNLNDQADNFLPKNREANTQKEFEELTNAFFDQGTNNEDIKNSLGATYTRKELIEVMRDAVATRNAGRLQFLKRFFKDGSISKLLVESHSRVVWMNDWYPLKELTYIIAVDKKQQRVMVVFRGAITAQDWKSAVNYKFHDIRNPVQDDFEGKSERLRVFSGLYKYLFRQRKDTGTTKYDEIANICHLYGKKEIGPEYKLFVTGHSLGGALTHFFSFFASTEERFTKNGPVKAIAFASPYIGGHSWADSIRHQERNKKLQLVQCRNDNDVIPRLPGNFTIGKRGPLWRHVGIGVTLPKLPGKCFRRKWKPMVHYWGKEKSCFDSTVHGYRRNIIFHFSWLQPWTLNRSHTLFELQDRLMYGEMMDSEDGGRGDFDLLHQTLDQLYGKLDEHDFQTLRKTRRWLGYKIAQRTSNESD